MHPHSKVCSAVGLAVFLLGANARAQEGQAVESLLLKGIQVESDPKGILGGIRDARALPFRPVDQVPFYGLPHGLIQTSVGRFAFRMDDLTLPGKIPIETQHVSSANIRRSFCRAPVAKPTQLPRRIGARH